MNALTWHVRGRQLALREPLLMGIVNVTPDSFSDGGSFVDPERAIEHAIRLHAEGAQIVDIGGESTRPGSRPVDAANEMTRILPVIEALSNRSDAIISVDTRRAEVARAALGAGAHIVNDVSALGDPAMGPTVAASGAGLVLMHMLGDPRTMQNQPHYQDVSSEVAAFLASRAAAAARNGVARRAIAIDPGLGFGKRTGAGIEDNVDLLKSLPRLCAAGFPVVVGASRKAFIGNLLDGAPVHAREAGSVAAAVEAARLGAHVLRVHDVASTRDALRVMKAVADARTE